MQQQEAPESGQRPPVNAPRSTGWEYRFDVIHGPEVDGAESPATVNDLLIQIAKNGRPENGGWLFLPPERVDESSGAMLVLYVRSLSVVMTATPQSLAGMMGGFNASPRGDGHWGGR